MEDDNGASISEAECQSIRDYARALFNQELLQRPQNLPKSWGHAIPDLYVKVVSDLSQQFPKFRFCHDNWKVNHFLSPLYSDWKKYSDGKKKQLVTHAGINVEQTKALSSESVSISPKRKRTATSSRIVKRTRNSASLNGSVESGQDAGDDKERSVSEVSESQMAPKVRQEVSNITPVFIPSFTDSVGSGNKLGCRARSPVSKIAFANICMLT